MKAVATILALAGAATVAAQQIPSDLPACGKTCATNMLGQARDLGCNPGDVPCLCRNVNFGNGIRDCSIQFCGNVQQANQVIAWGTTLCANANTPVSISSVSSVASPTGGAASPATSSPAAATSSSAAVVTVTESASTETGASTPISTSTFTSVLTSGSVTSTVTGESTIFGVGGVAGATSLPVTTITSPIVSTETQGTTTYETTVGTTTFESSITGSALSSALSSQASAASRTSSGQAAHMTGAPAFGVIAAAGFAAAFL